MAAAGKGKTRARRSPKNAREGKPWQGPDEQRRLLTPVADLKLAESNPRQGDVGAIVVSLERNGQFRPILANRRDSQILAGNHTYRAALELGWTEVAVVWVDASPEEATRILLADNRTNDLASYDEPLLTEVLARVVEDEGPDGLLGTGFEPEDLDALLDLYGEDRKNDLADDEVPPLPPKPKTKPGDLYLLGPHRLLCADATEPGVYERLMLDKEKVDCLWTDPPYGVSYEGRTRRKLTIANDDEAGTALLLDGAFALANAYLKQGARIYVAHPSGRFSLPFFGAFRERGWRIHQQILWVKNSLVVGHSDYHYQHEPMLHGSKAGGGKQAVQLLYGYTEQDKGRSGRGHDGWYGDNKATSVIEVDRPKASREHPTMKPPELIEVCLENSTSRSHLVLDCFAGSGSTLVACERLQRTCRLLELSPAYCDVIVERWETLTGEKAKKA